MKPKAQDSKDPKESKKLDSDQKERLELLEELEKVAMLVFDAERSVLSLAMLEGVAWRLDLGDEEDMEIAADGLMLAAKLARERWGEGATPEQVFFIYDFVIDNDDDDDDDDE